MRRISFCLGVTVTDHLTRLAGSFYNTHKLQICLRSAFSSQTWSTDAFPHSHVHPHTMYLGSVIKNQYQHIANISPRNYARIFVLQNATNPRNQILWGQLYILSRLVLVDKESDFGKQPKKASQRHY